MEAGKMEKSFSRCLMGLTHCSKWKSLLSLQCTFHQAMCVVLGEFSIWARFYMGTILILSIVSMMQFPT